MSEEHTSKKFSDKFGKKIMPIIPSERKEDLIGLNCNNPELILFMAGNQFMVMNELLEEFKNETGIENIFCETLPPGLLLKQILSGGAIFEDRILYGTPDVYTSVSIDAMNLLKNRNLIDDYCLYLHNRIALMVYKGNPKNICSVFDLAKDDIVVSQPNPENEHIAYYIIQMYRETGGDELVKKIMEDKVKSGKTLLTLVHHRETPKRIVNKKADVGPVWFTEIIYAKEKGLPISCVEVEHDQRDKVNYYACIMNNAPNIENARAFMKFLTSKKAKKIYRKYGFIPH